MFPASAATPDALGQAQVTSNPTLDLQHDVLKGNPEAVHEAVRYFLYKSIIYI